MEGLSRLLIQAAEQKEFSYHPGCKIDKLCHLSFTDDLMVFCKAEERPIQKLMDVLCLFGEISGLKINEAKSQIAIASVSNEIKS